MSGPGIVGPGMLPGRRGVQARVKLRLHERGDAFVRCAFCHDALVVAGQACFRCRTRLHEECWKEVPRCPTLGCFGGRIVCARRSAFTWLANVLTASAQVLTVFVAMLAVVAVLTRPVCGSGREAKIGAAKQQICNLECAIDMYEADVGRLPASLEDLRARPRNTPGWRGPYLKRDVPIYPWGDDYVYTLRTPQHGERGYVLLSYGPSGAPGDDEIRSDQLDHDVRTAQNP